MNKFVPAIDNISELEAEYIYIGKYIYVNIWVRINRYLKLLYKRYFILQSRYEDGGCTS